MQQRVLEVLRVHLDAAEPLTLSAIAKELDITPPTLQQHLEALAGKGHVVYESRGRGRAPVVRLPDPEPTPGSFVWPVVWRPMSETPPKRLEDHEVLLFAWHDGLCARVDVWTADEWGFAVPDPEVELHGWAVIKVPDVSTNRDCLDTSPAHVEGVDR